MFKGVSLCKQANKHSKLRTTGLGKSWPPCCWAVVWPLHVMACFRSHCDIPSAHTASLLMRSFSAVAFLFSIAGKKG